MIPSISSGFGAALSSQGISLVAFITALTTSFFIFTVQILAFILLKEKLRRIFKPKTYLAPERERTKEPPSNPWGWLFELFRYDDQEVIDKCGLDAYFFLRYLQTLLVIFIPIAIVTLPVLIPVNYIGGRGKSYALEFPNRTVDDSITANVTGLDQLAWGNIRPTKTHRYWAQLALAVLAITWVCAVFYIELREYIKKRQDYLKSAAATTILVRSIPHELLAEKNLRRIYGAFPGGVRNVWINRNCKELLNKIRQRDEVFRKLEAAETELIRGANRADKRQWENATSKKLQRKPTEARKSRLVKDKSGKDVIDEEGGGYRGYGVQNASPREPDGKGISETHKQSPLTRSGEAQSPILERGGARSLEKRKSFLGKVKAVIRLCIKDKLKPQEYPSAYDPTHKEDAGDAQWRKFVREKERPTHRIARFGWTPRWLPSVPLISPKTDTIYWCRKELARLNSEIEMDQKIPKRFPLMNSAFIQFNRDVAAHMACQTITHHVPTQMTPRTVEMSPNDIIWDNMSIGWWEAWVRKAVVLSIVAGMVFLWTSPVAWTASLAQITSVATKYKWLRWLNAIPQKVLQAIAGVLPTLVLGILLAFVPKMLDHLAFIQGVQTGAEKQLAVQTYYFAFLFVQVFLVVSISSGAVAALGSSATVKTIPETLATQLPKASNYFFSYMILQALSTSSGTLLQLPTLILSVVHSNDFDTARQKWRRRTTLPSANWGSYFPVYTNFGCIALVYSVVAPLIIIFAIITFTLLWIANRYNTLYVSRFQLDTGGLAYPRAINQSFAGLYVMELCLVGLFLLVRDDTGNSSCIPQAIIMSVGLALTILYQILLNSSLGPLFRHLPIEMPQENRQSKNGENKADHPPQTDGRGIHGSSSSRRPDLDSITRPSKVGAVEAAQCAILRANRLDLELQDRPFGCGTGSDTSDYKGGVYNNTTDDFQHFALRARQPTVWIPGDDLGVSKDEVCRTRNFSTLYIQISNVGAELDRNCRVVYNERNPPDFLEAELLNS